VPEDFEQSWQDFAAVESNRQFLLSLVDAQPGIGKLYLVDRDALS
jgi:hypothetical protein